MRYSNIAIADSHQIPHKYVVCISAVAWFVLDSLVSPATCVSQGVLAHKCLLLQAAMLRYNTVAVTCRGQRQ